jgi:hypothetical protein
LNEGDQELELGLAMAAAVNLGAAKREEARGGAGCMLLQSSDVSSRGGERRSGEELGRELMRRPAMAAAICAYRTRFCT